MGGLEFCISFLVILAELMSPAFRATHFFFVRTKFIRTTRLKIGEIIRTLSEQNSLLRTLILIAFSFFKYFLVGGFHEKGNCINGIIRKLCFNVRMTFAKPRTHKKRWET